MPHTPKRILIKISGEALSGGSEENTFDACVFKRLVHDILSLLQHNIQVSVVVGGGNILRGQSLSKGFPIDRPTSDALGMLATVMNGVMFAGFISDAGGVPLVMGPGWGCSTHLVHPYNHTHAMDAMTRGVVPIFVGGTGNSYFSTDTTAALRALETQCDCVIKVTNVDGVYSKDPLKHKDAVFYARLDYAQAISENLAVMDTTAFTLLKENQMRLIVCSVARTHELLSMISERGVCTHIS